MNETEVATYISENLSGLDIVEAHGDTFYFYDPDKRMDPARRLPFATIVTSDAYEQVSDLNRPGVFRLNVGVDKGTYRAMFGELPRASPEGAVLETGHDYAALDRIMPHPIYASLGWIGVLNPSEETFERVKPLLAEAHEAARTRYARRTGG